MRSVRVALVALLALVGLVAVALGVSALVSTAETDQHQAALAPFYTPPDPLPISPGTLLRSEPLGVEVPGGAAYRILYVSQTADGVATASGGMLFVPTAPAPAGGRSVVAWAHGTVGQADACAPSRSPNPLQDTDDWLGEMLSLGWVVVSTDYVGLGTPGTDQYLVAQAEVRDVVNAVRAARTFPGAEAGSRWVAWGHSQGGHSALWSGHLAPGLAPELSLVGVAAAAPAAELLPIMEAQWRGPVGWVIGPEVSVSWPTAAPRVSLDGVLSDVGASNYRRLADECVTPAAIEGLARSDLGEQFFAVDPTTRPDWAAAALAQTVPVLPATMPAYLAQGTADTVVLPAPNALLQRRWCAAGSALTVLWMGGVSHQAAATTAGPDAVAWMADRFAGVRAGRTCDTPIPVPASAP